MNDNEIIKSLKRCINGTEKCNLCPMFENCKTDINALEKHTLDLINRQNAEIDRLKDEIVDSNKIAKAEAIKEFAERLCEGRVSNDPVVIAVKVELKEMVGDAE